MTDEEKVLVEIRDLLKNTILNQPLRIETIDGATYEGYAQQIGLRDEDASWFILRRYTDGNLVSVQFASTKQTIVGESESVRNDAMHYNKAWAKKLNYSYS